MRSTERGSAANWCPLEGHAAYRAGEQQRRRCDGEAANNRSPAKEPALHLSGACPERDCLAAAMQRIAMGTPPPCLHTTAREVLGRGLPLLERGASLAAITHANPLPARSKVRPWPELNASAMGHRQTVCAPRSHGLVQGATCAIGVLAYQTLRPVQIQRRPKAPQAQLRPIRI